MLVVIEGVEKAFLANRIFPSQLSWPVALRQSSVTFQRSAVVPSGRPSLIIRRRARRIARFQMSLPPDILMISSGRRTFAGRSWFRLAKRSDFAILLRKHGAGDEDRTRNFQLGKLTLYH